VTEVWEMIFEALSGEEAGLLLGGASAGALVLAPIAFAYRGLLALHDAHEAGLAQAMCIGYAQTWARVFAAGVCRGVAESVTIDHVDEQLDEARRRGRHDAFAALGTLNPERARALGKRLLEELGQEAAVRNALAEQILRGANYEGLVFHERTPAERAEDQAGAEASR
jgi:hypothetical protein